MVSAHRNTANRRAEYATVSHTQEYNKAPSKGLERVESSEFNEDMSEHVDTTPASNRAKTKKSGSRSTRRSGKQALVGVDKPSLPGQRGPKKVAKEVPSNHNNPSTARRKFNAD